MVIEGHIPAIMGQDFAQSLQPGIAMGQSPYSLWQPDSVRLEVEHVLRCRAAQRQKFGCLNCLSYLLATVATTANNAVLWHSLRCRTLTDLDRKANRGGQWPRQFTFPGSFGTE